MRSRKYHSVSSTQVHGTALQWLQDSKLLKARSARSCTDQVVWSVVLAAAAKMISICAACRDLVNGPSAQAIFDALRARLPRTIPVLERRLNESFTSSLPKRHKRRAHEMAIDWHLVPYYGDPLSSRNEIYRSKPKQGTSNFHAYATACITHHGARYTLALSWVRRNESTTTVLKRLLDRIDALGLKIKALLLDRAFFHVQVVTLLKERRIRFLMPVMFRGRRTKKGRAHKGLRRIAQQGAGRYDHTLKNRQTEVGLTVVVAYRTYKTRAGRRRQQKLLFGCWGISGSPTEIRERYRKRFGIESSYRQLRQARIYTCTRDPHLRLVFIAIALMLRNLWVWLHDEVLSETRDGQRVIRLHLLRFKQLLSWITQAVLAQLHDGSTFMTPTAN